MLFKKKEKSCCCSGCAEPKTTGNEKILILGSGCPKCNLLEKNVVTVLKNKGIDEPVGHVKDYTEIASYGVMSTPALVIDGKVVSFGKVLSEKEIEQILENVR